MPDGWLPLFEAWQQLGKASFGDEWLNGRELAARSAKEITDSEHTEKWLQGRRERKQRASTLILSPAHISRAITASNPIPQRQIRPQFFPNREVEIAARKRGDWAWNWLTQWLYAGKSTAIALDAEGHLHPIPPNIWGKWDAKKILHTGLAEFTGSTGLCVQGHVLLSRSELDQVISGDAPESDSASVATETKCQKWLIEMMKNNSRPEKPKKKYRADAKSRFGVGTKAFDRVWANAIAATGNTNWSKPGPKS